MITSEDYFLGNGTIYSLCGEVDNIRYCYWSQRDRKTVSLLEYSLEALPNNNGLKFLFEIPAKTFWLFLLLIRTAWEQIILRQFFEEVNHDK